MGTVSKSSKTVQEKYTFCSDGSEDILRVLALVFHKVLSCTILLLCKFYHFFEISL